MAASPQTPVAFESGDHVADSGVNMSSEDSSGGGAYSRRDAEALLATVAHELRTPISTVCGLVEILRDGEPDPVRGDRRQLWDALWRQSRRLGVLVEDLLDVANLDGSPVVTSTAVLVGEAVADALESAPPPPAVTVGVSMHDLPDGSPLSVRVERTTLPRVLVNLLTNAYRYGAARVSIEAARDGPFVAITVEDDGPGVPDAIRSKLFDPYVRGTNSEGHHGLGIGLALARNLVDDAGGRLSYRRRNPTGSSFLIELPFVAHHDSVR